MSDFYDFDNEGWAPEDFKDFRDFFLAQQMAEGEENRRLILVDAIEPVAETDSQHFSVIPYIIYQILRFNREDKEDNIEPSKRKPIILYINAPGGDVAQGYALVSVIACSKTPVYTVAFGMCASMAFLVFLAGHKRFAFPFAIFLMHDGWMALSGTSSKVKDQMQFNDRLEKVTKNYILKHSKMPEKEYDEKFHKEVYMFPEDALEYGFADKIVDDIDEVL